jgi:diguanylate cyclase (GGDEF)-like protein/PAS domain S-box-containing protein
MFDDSSLDPESIAQAAASLLADHPDASVAAMASFAGFYCDVPKTVPLHGQEVVRTGRLYEMVPSRFRVAVFDAWRRVRQHGVGTATVTTHADEPATMYFFDTRPVHGVVLAIVVPGEPHTNDLSDLGPEAPARSRFGRFWRDDLGRIQKMDEAGEQLLGFRSAELCGQEPIPFIHPDDHELAFENYIETLASPGQARRWRCRHRRGDGSWLWVEITNTNLLEDPAHGMVLSEMMDISEEMEANERLREREELLQRLAESMPLGIVQAEPDGRVVYTNRRLHEMVGVSHAASLSALFTLAVGDDRHRLAAAVDRVAGSGVDSNVDLRLDRPGHGHQRICHVTVQALRDGEGKISGTVLTVEDVTEATMLRREMERRATVDPLTGCRNRAATMTELERALSRAVQPDMGTGVVFIDLDEFKPINDRLGHAAGDEVLVAAADRLRRSVRTEDVVGRLGGDEFIVVCPSASRPELTVEVAQRIVEQLAEPLELTSGERVRLRASIGVAWEVNGETTADGLVARADAAMYESKRQGTGSPVLAQRTRPAESTAD